MSDGSGCKHERLVKSFKVPTSLECGQCGKIELRILRYKVDALKADKVGLLKIIADLQDHRDAEWEGSGGMPTYAGLEAELAALKEAAQAEVDRQRHQCGILRQELQPTTAALVSLLQEKGG